jgi:hypothetical protein
MIAIMATAISAPRRSGITVVLIVAVVEPANVLVPAQLARTA